jgi:hypothetical protein
MLLWVWVAAVALLLYAPIGAQRRFVEGVQVPLAILATWGLYEAALPRLKQAHWFQALARRPKYSAAGLERLCVAALILLLAVPNLYLYVSALTSLGVDRIYPIFRPRAETEAMEWLAREAKADDLVLSAYLTGSYLPYRAGTRVFIGQRYETVDFQSKQRAVEAFFSTMSDAERVAFLRGKGISLVFYGRAERDLGAFDPAAAPFLRRVYANQEAQIFEVVAP